MFGKARRLKEAEYKRKAEDKQKAEDKRDFLQCLKLEDGESLYIVIGIDGIYCDDRALAFMGAKEAVSWQLALQYMSPEQARILSVWEEVRANQKQQNRSTGLGTLAACRAAKRRLGDPEYSLLLDCACDADRSIRVFENGTCQLRTWNGCVWVEIKP